jgi:hypothetical protein
MMREIDIYGLLVSPLLVCAAIALLLTWCLRWLLDRLGLDRWIWHSTLFDLALFVIVLGLVTIAAG